MKWIDTFAFVMRSSLTTFRARVEDPERLLHQLVIDMEEDLLRVRENVASAIADELQLERELKRAREETQRWMDRARSALECDREEDSKAALERKLVCERREKSLDDECARQRKQTADLQRSVRDLEDKIRQARQKKTILLARMVRAESERRIKRSLRRADSRSAVAQFERLESRVDRAEDMVRAYDRLDGEESAAGSLAEKFQAEEERRKLESEFEELKKRVDPEAL